MNFGKDESFFERHQYFFQKFYFKFEGLNDEIQIGFEDVVKRLNGIICIDADYILTEKSYFLKTENKNRKDLYSIHYILDSIKAKQPLDINKYRFISEKSYQSNVPCCLFSKYVLRLDSCERYYYNNICCRLCADNDTDESISNTVENNSTKSNTNSNYIILSNTKFVNKNFIRNEISNLSFHSSTEGNDSRKKDLRKLNGISNWKVKVKSEFNNMQSLKIESFIISQDTKEKNENNNINMKVMFDGKGNRIDELPTILLMDEKTNESAKKFKMSHNNPIKTQQSNEDSDFKMHSKTHKEKNKISGKMIQSDDNEKHVTKYKHKENVSSDNEWILSSNDDTNKNSKLNAIFKYKRVRNSVSSSDSSIVLSDSSNIHNQDTRQARKPNKKLYGKRRCRHNVSLARNSSSSSEDEISKITNKIRKFNTIRSTKKRVQKRNINERKLNPESSEGKLSFTSSDEFTEKTPNEWWSYLPVLKNVTPNFVEPRRNLGDRRRGSSFSLQEQRLMIAYLIKNNKIHLGTSRLPWREMHIDGYMRNRSSESLNNNFRKVILPKIDTFGLPSNILLQFLILKQ